jgi:hypothetical protein
VVEVRRIDRAINASAHEGRRRLCRGGMLCRAHHVELLMVVLLRPLVVAWGLHDGRNRGGLISCWRRRAAIASALSRQSCCGGSCESRVFRGAASGPRRMSRGMVGRMVEWERSGRAGVCGGDVVSVMVGRRVPSF